MKQSPRRPQFQTQMFAPRTKLPRLAELPKQTQGEVLSGFAQLLRQIYQASLTQQQQDSDE